jgi:hypothetical protein
MSTKAESLENFRNTRSRRMAYHAGEGLEVLEEFEQLVEEMINVDLMECDARGYWDITEEYRIGARLKKVHPHEDVMDKFLAHMSTREGSDELYNDDYGWLVYWMSPCYEIGKRPEKEKC